MSQSTLPYGVQLVPLMQCPVAGVQYHAGESSRSRMSPGDALVLRREPGNRHDPRAVIVEWQGVVLGYVPREANYALSQMLDRGERVEGRVRSLRPGGDPWQWVMMDVVWAAAGAPQPAPPAPAPVFAAPPVLVRSLANRIFGSPPPAGATEWVAARAAALALVGIEHPAILPFLRVVACDKTAFRSSDPVATLQGMLLGAGMEENAWKRLERWGYSAFRALGADVMDPACIARYANLLLRMDLLAPPPPEFAAVAFAMGRHRSRIGAPPDLERLPTWLLRGALEALLALASPDEHAGLVADARCAVDWLLDTRPEVDANQRRAGWSWVMGQARAFKKARALAAKARWQVPAGEMTFGNWWVVPIRCPAQLADEAAAMKNCLEDYESELVGGDFAVYSIRDALTTERFACFSVARDGAGDPWSVQEAVGRMNRSLDEELCAVVDLALDRINASASPGPTP